MLGMDRRGKPVPNRRRMRKRLPTISHTLITSFDIDGGGAQTHHSD